MYCTVLTNEEEVLKRWKYYFEGLMNVENPIERREEEPPLINCSVHVVTRDEVKTALQKMQKGKALGPNNVPIEAWQKFAKSLQKFSSIQQPSSWRENAK